MDWFLKMIQFGEKDALNAPAFGMKLLKRSILQSSPKAPPCPMMSPSSKGDMRTPRIPEEYGIDLYEWVPVYVIECEIRVLMCWCM